MHLLLEASSEEFFVHLKERERESSVNSACQYFEFEQKWQEENYFTQMSLPAAGILVHTSIPGVESLFIMVIFRQKSFRH